MYLFILCKNKIKMISNNNNNKKVTSISINTSTSKYLSNKYYSSILYILIKKGFTYYGELKKMLGVTSNYHINVLIRDNILILRPITETEKDYLKTLHKNIGNEYLNNLNVAIFTSEAMEYFTQPKIYDLLKIFSMPYIDENLILQQNRYEQIKLSQERKWLHKKQLLQKKGIVLDDTTSCLQKDLNKILIGDNIQ